MKKYIFKTKVLSSIIHTEDVSSNISNIYREKKLINNKIHNIPAIHGNSIRGILRRIAMNRLCELVNIKKKSISEKKYHFLFNGGALDAGIGYIELDKKQKLRKLLPILSIFGSAMSNDMLQGKMIITTALPQCKEIGNGEISYNNMTNIIRYIRIDDFEKNNKDNQMFYEIEVLINGCILEWEIILDYCNKLEIEALEDTLIEFSKKPYIGGARAKGHGKIEFDFKGKNQNYLNFIDKNKNKIKKYILN